MNPRVVPITVAIVSFSIAVFFVAWFADWWRWVVASPLLVLVTWPSLKIALFSSKREVEKMTGADKWSGREDDGSGQRVALLLALFSVLRFVAYAMAFGIGYAEIPYYFTFAAAILVVTFKSLSDPTRFNILRDKWRSGQGFTNALFMFVLADVLGCFVLFGIGRGIRVVFG